MPAEPWTRPAPDRIVLVGFMAAGKTTVGRILAERLGWDFVDLDTLVERSTGRTPGAIIREDGEVAFRRIEAAVMAEQAARRRVVVAPGGGWGADPERTAVPPGTVRVWLRLSAAEAVRRAEAEADAVDRPLLGAAEGRLERAEALLAKREPGYAAADVVVDVNGRSPEAVVDEIQRLVIEAAGGR